MNMTPVPAKGMTRKSLKIAIKFKADCKMSVPMNSSVERESWQGAKRPIDLHKINLEDIQRA